MCVAFYFLFLQFLPIATDEMDETQKNMKVTITGEITSVGRPFLTRNFLRQISAVFPQYRM